MSAGNCPRCGGDGHRPSRHGNGWTIICFYCQGTGNFPPTHSPLYRLWSRFTNWCDRLLTRWGVT